MPTTTIKLNDQDAGEKRRKRRTALLILFAISALFYVTIMYKIINFGP